MAAQSGIYEIVNTANGKRYIGSAISFKDRWKRHRSRLRAGDHHSIKLQRAWNKYGEASFKFLPILTCQPNMLLFYEQQLLDKVKPEYNIAPVAGSPLGVKHSAKSRANMSAASKGKPKSPEHCATMSRTRKGRKSPRSPEHQAKLTASRVGKKFSPEARANMSAAHVGKTLTEEHKAKIGAAGRGKKRTAETKARMSAAQMGNKKAAGRKSPHTEAAKLRISQAKSGVPWTPARRAAFDHRKQEIQP